MNHFLLQYNYMRYTFLSYNELPILNERKVVSYVTGGGWKCQHAVYGCNPLSLLAPVTQHQEGAFKEPFKLFLY